MPSYVNLEKLTVNLLNNTRSYLRTKCRRNCGTENRIYFFSASALLYLPLFFFAVWITHMFAVFAFLMFSSLSSLAIPHLPFLILWESILPSRHSLPTAFYDHLYAECNLYELTRS